MSKKIIKNVRSVRTENIDGAVTEHSQQLTEMELGETKTKVAAETVKIETETAIMQEEHEEKMKYSKKDRVLKIFQTVGTLLAAISPFAVAAYQCHSTEKIRQADREHIANEHDKALSYEQYGPEYIQTSQAGKRIIAQDIQIK